MKLSRCSGFVVLTLAGLMLTGSIVAAEMAPDAARFSAQRARIEKAIGNGVRYAELSRAERANVLKALDRIDRALASVADPAQLPAETVEAIKADQAYVNAVLAEAEQMSSLHCQTTSTLGSNIRGRRCETEGARRRREAEEDRNGQNRLDLLRM